MSDLQSLITLLADGRCYSGELLGQHMGVSRTAVWKQLKKLPELGLNVASVKGKGYQISPPVELLDRERLLAQLPDLIREKLLAVDVAFMANSTNAMALEQAGYLEDGKAYVCLAEYQSQGRGRRGRNWVSPLGRNIYLSFAWQFQGGVGVLEGLSLAVGVQIIEALNSLGIEGASLKWPNDILVDGKKLGGILLEMVGDPSGSCQVVIGVGVNVDMEEQKDIGQPWTSLAALSPTPISRNELAAAIIAQMLLMLHSYAEKGFSAYADRWREKDAFAGKVVNLLAGKQSIQGIARGVTDSGALQLELDGELQTFYGGELSLRLDKSDDS